MDKDESIISIKQLSKIYHNQEKIAYAALDSLELEVPKGKILALLGPNGAGKSTLINILAGITIKTTGKVFISCFDIDADLQQAKAKIGIVPQEISLDPFFTVREYVTFMAGYYSRKVSVAEVNQLLSDLGLLDKADCNSRKLSGGMKRRLMVAKALIHKPEILILDEPTAGVDIELREAMWDYVRKLNQDGTTIILTTHYLNEAQELSDNIAFINKGKIVKYDTKDNILNFGTRKMILHTYDPVDVEKVIPNLSKKYSVSLSDLNLHELHIQMPKDVDLNQMMVDISSIQSLKIANLEIVQEDLNNIFKKMINT